MKTTTASLLAGFALLALTTASVHAQESQPWHAPEPDRWVNLNESGLKMGIFNEWELEENEERVNVVSPDHTIHIFAEQDREDRTIEQILAHLDTKFDEYTTGFNLTSGQNTVEDRDMKLATVHGTAQLKSDGSTVIFQAEIFETPAHKLFVVGVFGTQKDFDNNETELIYTLASIQHGE